MLGAAPLNRSARTVIALVMMIHFILLESGQQNAAARQANWRSEKLAGQIPPAFAGLVCTRYSLHKRDVTCFRSIRVGLRRHVYH